MLTLPADGLIVPAKATTSSRAKSWTIAKATPVAVIRLAPASSSRCRSWREPIIPMPSVSSAEPSSAAVAIAPISSGEKPSAIR